MAKFLKNVVLKVFIINIIIDLKEVKQIRIAYYLFEIPRKLFLFNAK